MGGPKTYQEMQSQLLHTSLRCITLGEVRVQHRESEITVNLKSTRDYTACNAQLWGVVLATMNTRRRNRRFLDSAVMNLAACNSLRTSHCARTRHERRVS